MNKEALLALATKWQRIGAEPVTRNENPDYQLVNATSDGFRVGVNKCADDLIALVKLLGGLR